MRDLIDRQAAIDAIRNIKAITGTHDDEILLIDKAQAQTELMMLPSAEPKRKKGKWQWLSSTYDRTPCEMRYMCSECHHETILHTNETSHPWENFCPNCGAKMEG